MNRTNNFDEACFGLGIHNPFDGHDNKDFFRHDDCRPKCFEKRRCFEEVEKVCVFKREIPCRQHCNHDCRPCFNDCKRDCDFRKHDDKKCDNHKHDCHIINRCCCFNEFLRCLFCGRK